MQSLGIIVVLLAPLALLFFLLRRHTKERFWWRFGFYTISAIAGGVVFVFLAGMVFRFIDPIYQAYTVSATNFLYRLGCDKLAEILKQTHPYLIWLMFWYLGMSFPIWTVWRHHYVSNRKVANSHEQPVNR
jgi:hypothetical protein